MKLIRKLLQFSPHNRPSIKEVLEDRWLTGGKLVVQYNNFSGEVNDWHISLDLSNY
jgi:hypothetical protein